MLNLPNFSISHEVDQAIKQHMPVVALESTVITHGLPYPDNLTLAREMEEVIRHHDAIPATISVLDGKILVGTNAAQLARLSNDEGLLKVSRRDFALAIQQKKSGGTTVAGTMFVASKVGIRVFATGGIGGVHRQENARTALSYDISTDLYALASIPMIVVCAGAKAILDLPATLEVLETLGVPVIGYQTDNFPAFYSRTSGLKTTMLADSPREIIGLAKIHWDLGIKTAILVVVPPPEEVALPLDVVNQAIEKAMNEAKIHDVHGQNVTPFLLEKVSEYTKGLSLRANLGLLINNARVASLISRETNELV